MPQEQITFTICRKFLDELYLVRKELDTLINTLSTDHSLLLEAAANNTTSISLEQLRKNYIQSYNDNFIKSLRKEHHKLNKIIEFLEEMATLPEETVKLPENNITVENKINNYRTKKKPKAKDHTIRKATLELLRSNPEGYFVIKEIADYIIHQYPEKAASVKNIKDSTGHVLRNLWLNGLIARKARGVYKALK